MVRFKGKRMSDHGFEHVQKLPAEPAARHGGAEERLPLSEEQFPGEHARGGIRQRVGQAAGQQPAARALEEQRGKIRKSFFH